MAEGALAPTSGGKTTEDVGTGAVAGGTKSRRSTATKVQTRGGVRAMKMYSLTEGELGELSALRWEATVAFSLTTACLGFWVSVTQAIDFSENLSPVVKATWETWKTASLAVAVLSALVGVWLVYKGFTRLNAIKSEMAHD